MNFGCVCFRFDGFFFSFYTPHRFNGSWTTRRSFLDVTEFFMVTLVEKLSGQLDCISKSFYFISVSKPTTEKADASDLIGL